MHSRLHNSVKEAALEHLGTTEASRAYCEAYFEVLWDYGEHTLLEHAISALASGNLEGVRRALADERRLNQLGELANRAEAEFAQKK